MSISGLWLPESARERPLPFQCAICKDRYPDAKSLGYHVDRCFDQNADQVLAMNREKRDAFFEAPDPEWQAYNQALRGMGKDPMSQYGRKGKKTVKRSLES